MHRAAVERIFASADAQKACTLLEGLGSEPRDLKKLGSAAEASLLAAVCYNALRERRPDAGYISQ